MSFMWLGCRVVGHAFAKPQGRATPNFNVAASKEETMTTKTKGTPDAQHRIDHMADKAKVVVDKVSEAAQEAVAKTNEAAHDAAKATSDKVHEVSKFVGEKVEEAGKKLEAAGKKMGH